LEDWHAKSRQGSAYLFYVGRCGFSKCCPSKSTVSRPLHKQTNELTYQASEQARKEGSKQTPKNINANTYQHIQLLHTTYQLRSLQRFVLICRIKFRSQTSDLWADAATSVRAVREEEKSEEKESVEEDESARKGRPN